MVLDATFYILKDLPMCGIKPSLIRVCCMLLLYCNIYSNKCSTLTVSRVVFITDEHIFNIRRLLFQVSDYIDDNNNLSKFLFVLLLCHAIFNLKELWHIFGCSALCG